MHDITPVDVTRPPNWMPWLLVAAGLAVYANGLFGPFIFDDASIEHNENIRHIWPPWRAMTAPPQSSLSARPVVSLTFAANYVLGGSDVVGYHLVNLAIHICAALTLFGVLRRTLSFARFGSWFGYGSPRLAWVAALIWTVHPLHTESVTYLIQRTESLMGLFYLLTLYCLIRAWDSHRPIGWYLATVVACGLGMGCKEVMATAPLVVLLYDRTFLAKSLRRASRDRWVLYAALAATWLWLAWLVTSQPRSDSAGFSLAHLSSLDYAKSQFGVVANYLRLAVWPDSLCLYYDWPLPRFAREIVPPAILVGGLLMATIWAVWQRPVIGFLGAWFFLTLAPTSSLIPISDLAFEHRMYLPLAAVCVLVVVVGHKLIEYGTRRFALTVRTRTVVAYSLVIAWVAALGVRTILRNEDYRSAVSIWSTVVEQRPNVWRARYNLGCALAAANRQAEAIPHYREALRLNPGFVDAYINMGVALASQGRFDEAMDHYQWALDIKPDYCKAYLNMGLDLETQGKHEEAIRALRRALACDPNYAEAHFYLGQISAVVGRFDEATQHFRDAHRLRPGWSAPGEAMAVIDAARKGASGDGRTGE